MAHRLGTQLGAGVAGLGEVPGVPGAGMCWGSLPGQGVSQEHPWGDQSSCHLCHLVPVMSPPGDRGGCGGSIG